MQIPHKNDRLGLIDYLIRHEIQRICKPCPW